MPSPTIAATPFVVAFRVLVELNHVAGVILRRVRFLGIGQVRRNPCLDEAFLAKPAVCLEAVANGLGDAFRLCVRRAHDECRFRRCRRASFLRRLKGMQSASCL